MGNNVSIAVTLSAVLFFSTLPLSADSLHIMQSGDTLYSLSREYGVSVQELLSANEISDPGSLSVGMRLIVPGVGNSDNNTEVEEYTVKKGDTYYSIARAHGMVVDELLSLNSRDSGRVLNVDEILVVGLSQGGGKPIGPIITPGPDPVPEPRTGSTGPPTRVTRVPWWPVAGLKAALDGKLVGVSIAADPRSYVHAVADGSVVWTGPYRGFGHVVLVDSDGFIYLYGGNEDLFVNVGQNIATGSRIGRLGPSGPGGETQEMIFSVFREGIPVSPDDAPRG